MQRLAVKVSFIVLIVLSNTASFGMVPCNQDNGEINPFSFDALLQELQIRVINAVSDPLILGQTSKQNHAMVKKLGMDNIRTVYQEQNQRLTLSLYVPLLSMDISSSRKENRHHWVYISPYHKSFYSETDELINFKELKILENNKYCQTHSILGIEYYRESFNHPIVSAALFGGDEDVVKELKQYKEYFEISDDMNASTPGHIVWRALNLLIRYSNSKNNAFELLLKDKKDDIAKKDDLHQHAGSYYTLLLLADKYNNKKAFTALIAQDPYSAKNLLYKGLDSRELKTVLDRMLKDGCFDPENVALFIASGGKTTEQLQELK